MPKCAAFFPPLLQLLPQSLPLSLPQSLRALSHGLAFGAALWVLAPVPASADQILDFSTLDEIESLLKGFGSVERDTDREGIAMFRGRIDGKKYSLFFYDCDGTTNCKSATFSAFFDGADYITDLSEVNDFNYEYRFGKASVDADGDLVFDYSFSLMGGLPRDTFDDTIDWWREVLSDGEGYFDPDTHDEFKGDPTPAPMDPSQDL
ncbi:YbjN domain-containing protein [Celeribacter baekdonensis]|uniref:YbjN domain-containing protein n=1 Tax=Celeribacter baekdonensis TaxID=875171 RepID=UPI003A8F0C99